MFCDNLRNILHIILNRPDNNTNYHSESFVRKLIIIKNIFLVYFIGYIRFLSVLFF